MGHQNHHQRTKFQQLSLSRKASCFSFLFTAETKIGVLLNFSTFPVANKPRIKVLTTLFSLQTSRKLETEAVPVLEWQNRACFNPLVCFNLWTSAL